MAGSRSFVSFGFSVVAALAIAAATAVSFAYDRVITFAVAASDFAFSRVRDWVARAVESFKREKLEHPVVSLSQAQVCAHATRIAKRERPLTFGAWRMCPSC